MKFTAILAALALPALALAAPAPAAEAEAFPAPEAEAQAPSGGPDGITTFSHTTVTCIPWDAVNYRECPRADSGCRSHGRYPIGIPVHLVCITTGQSIFGNIYWVKASNGYYSSAYYFGGCTPTNFLPWC
ncbi:hypothetical protein FN846DRAFT_917514 [Sphaerosporella brunnea]|uniref:Ig-like domain-containing protein n=1 Tax=Sphaerosporella brunnea TaxID=1250544 RepID=A0A5J5F3E6_9PEZI|nr:hypothetical protein FN846DRAFT_917514 [Sphaerosporella brunnea]